ncbi:hypothetical protein RF11_09688 [Thelohanellus kitauei]|uniref:Uncharacterized protein n=1 Tax=Thelohanellus kitauei TaxID=669202 RepID=A0A0C2N209_THEKT|nr:hypothetical protein RF11_09688 [Thelohanellus kitauei]
MEEVMKEVERSCLGMQGKDNAAEINRADKFLLGLMKGNSLFCFELSLRLLKSNCATEAMEYATKLLYHTLKSMDGNISEVQASLIKEIIQVVLESKSENLTFKLCQILCYLILKNEDKQPTKVLELLVKLSIQNHLDPDNICLDFFMAFADEYNRFVDLESCHSAKKIGHFTPLIQAHVSKIIAGNNVNLKVKALKCFDFWVQQISVKDISCSLVIVISGHLTNDRLTDHAYDIIQTIIDFEGVSNSVIQSLELALVKNLYYVFPYLTISDSKVLAEVPIASNVQHNVYKAFVNFAQVNVIKRIVDEMTWFKETKAGLLNILIRLTAIGSFYMLPPHQSHGMMVYPYNFWNDFFDNETVKQEMRNLRFYNLFTELFYIFLQKVTFSPWVTRDSVSRDVVREIRVDVAQIFQKMAAIQPDLLLHNIYVTYKIFEQKTLENMDKLYLLEAAAFVLGCVVNIVPVTNDTLRILSEIFSSVPILCSKNINFVLPMLKLLSKSSQFLLSNLLPVFVDMIDKMSHMILNSHLLDNHSKEIMYSCVNFTAIVMEKLNSGLNPVFLDKIIKLFGEMFTMILKQVKNGQNFDSFLSSKNKKAYLSTVKIVVRAMSCQCLDGNPHESEIYVAQLIKDVIDLFEACSFKIASQHSPHIYKDVITLTQILDEMSQGLLISSPSGRGGLKLIFERLFSGSLMSNAFFCLKTSNIFSKILVDIVERCLYQDFRQFVQQAILNNFACQIIGLITANNWQLAPIVVKYIKIIITESSAFVEPIDFVLNPLLHTGLSCLDPFWDQAPQFLTFLVDIMKSLPPHIVFYHHISLETSQMLVMKLLEFSYMDNLPEVSLGAVKCLKKMLKCTIALGDSTPLLMTRYDQSSTITLIDYLLNSIVFRMVTRGERMVVLLYPVLMVLSSLNSNQFVKKLYDCIFSEKIIPTQLVDSDVIRSFYWQFVDNYTNKERGLEIFIKFFSSISNKLNC